MKIKKDLLRNRGFTYMEALVGMAIFIIIAVSTAANFRYSNPPVPAQNRHGKFS